MESKVGDLDSANRVKSSRAKHLSFCFFLLLQKEESPYLLDSNPPSKAKSQNLQDGLMNLFLDSAKKFCTILKFRLKFQFLKLNVLDSAFLEIRRIYQKRRI